MESRAMTDGPIGPEEDAAALPPTVVDLSAGSAQITPVVVDGEARYEVDLPDRPLAEEDVESLAVALHAAQAGAAVLVDVEEYVEAVAAAELAAEDVPQEDPGHEA